MSETHEFLISQRHYDIIIKQAEANYPQESGGFLGGKGFLVQAVLPAFNLHGADKTDTFMVSSEDILRAHEFFAKHNLEYFAVYHSHPDAEPYPSPQDVATGQKFHFIVGLNPPAKPVFCAYQIHNRAITPLPFKIVPDKHFSVVDIHGKTTVQQMSPIPTPNKEDVARDPLSEAKLLGQLIDDIKQEKPHYPKLSPRGRESDFSTLA